MSLLFTAVLLVLAAATVSVIGFLLATKHIPDRWLVADTDAAGALYATIGMVYAILIAIAAISVWEDRGAAGANTDLEAARLTEAAWTTNSLAPGDRLAIRENLRGYLETAAGPEWTSLRDRHAGSAAAEQLFFDLRRQVEAIEPASERQQLAREQLAGQLSEAATARRARIAMAGAAMPAMLWPLLIIGGILSVAFLYLFGLERTFPNALMLAIVSGMVTVLLFVLYQMEYPFSRAFAIEPDSLLAALSFVSRLPAPPGG